MSFNPLGNFRPDQPISQGLLEKGRAFGALLPDLPDGSFFERIYLHWSGAHYGYTCTLYSAEVSYEAPHWNVNVKGNLLATARADQANEIAATWLRNGHSFAIALAGMFGASPTNFGSEPVTIAGIDIMLVAAAAAGLKYKIDLTGMVDGYDAYQNAVIEPTVMTHGEVAIVDHYWPGDAAPDGTPATDTRWDFATLVALQRAMTLQKADAKTVGDAFRLRAHNLKVALLG